MRQSKLSKIQVDACLGGSLYAKTIHAFKLYKHFKKAARQQNCIPKHQEESKGFIKAFRSRLFWKMLQQGLFFLQFFGV